MAEGNVAANRWLYGLAYFAVMAVFMLFQILPIETGPGRVPGPDLMVGLTFAWVLRRPRYAPTPLIALVFLIADLLFMRPPGLWTALVVVAVEVLRAREAGSREQPFPFEWALVAGTLLAITLADWLILAVFMVDRAGIGLVLLQFLATVFAYPLIVLALRLIFGVRKMAPGEVDALGRRV